MKLIRKFVFIILVLVVIALPLAALMLPVYRIYGTGMEPTLHQRDLTVGLKCPHYQQGDLVAMTVNHKLLVKRVIATAGQQVDITRDGEVYVDQHSIAEPYVYERVRGEPDITFPLIVPEGSLFVLGDNRAETIDSRKREFGCIEEAKIEGMLLGRIWPLQDACLFNLPHDTGWIQVMLEAIRRQLG